MTRTVPPRPDRPAPITRSGDIGHQHALHILPR